MAEGGLRPCCCPWLPPGPVEGGVSRAGRAVPQEALGDGQPVPGLAA